MNNQQDIDKFLRLAEKNMPNQSFEYAKETARRFALRYGKPYVVIKGSGWQVWSKEMCEKLGRDWEYCAEVEE